MVRNFGVEEKVEFKEKVVQVRRVTKVVKGGKRMGFRACVIVGNLSGEVGLGVGKAAEVPDAVKKGITKAKKSLLTVPIVGTTIPHQTWGHFGASDVLIKPAPAGTGVIAGGAVRLILELAGIRDAVAKVFGSPNVLNSGQAALVALKNLKSSTSESKRRGQKVFSKWTVSFEEEEEVEKSSDDQLPEVVSEGEE
jgi:small subunit ribosomal protein S5